MPATFTEKRVIALESRRADDMVRLIERFGGQALNSPSMKEVPLAVNRPAIDLANRIITGQIDGVIWMTGVGVRYFLGHVERHVDRQQLLEALSDIQMVARGPKPVAALREAGLAPTVTVPEPNTWREVLQTLDARLPVANLTIGIQEYGKANPSLVAGLEARGARVETVRVYNWDLPDDIEPLRANVERIARGEADVVLFTAAAQAMHLLQVAVELDLEHDLRRGLQNIVVASIGPTTSETLRDADLPVDLEPVHPKMGQLVQAAAEQCEEILARKQQVRVVLQSQAGTGSNPEQPAWWDSPMMRACRREKSDVTPVWLMRQAGRYMPEYREVRSRVSFLELCRSPQLCSEVMCQAVEYLGVDAAIIFSDLLPILEPMGMDLEFTKGDGPVIHNPIRETADVKRLLELESTDALHYVMETVKQTRADLTDSLPLIGFAGAPFTLASYAIEGGSSRNYLFTKTLMYRDRAAWDELMSRFVRAITLYLNAQIKAGAQIVQIFDSWVGCLSVRDYRTYVMPHMRELLQGLDPSAPVIQFGTGNPLLLSAMTECGGDVVGADWRIPLDAAWKEIGYDKAIQGNLDPVMLLAPTDSIRDRVEEILNQAASRPGHIFNLGHGILPQTPPESARALVEFVHELSAR